MRLIDGVVEAKALSDLPVTRIPQHAVTAADQHGHIGRGHTKAVEQVLRVDVTIEVDVLIRMAVAYQKLLHPQRASTVRRANQDDIPKAAGNQLGPAEDERPHEDLAQFGIGLYEGEQLLVIELDHLTRLADAQSRQRPAAGDHVALARELPRPVTDDQRLRTV